MKVPRVSAYPINSLALNRANVSFANPIPAVAISRFAKAGSSRPAAEAKSWAHDQPEARQRREYSIAEKRIQRFPPAILPRCKRAAAKSSRAIQCFQEA